MRGPRSQLEFDIFSHDHSVMKVDASNGTKTIKNDEKPLWGNSLKKNKIISLALKGMPIKDIAKEKGIPHQATIFRWLNKDEQFRNRMHECSPMHHIKKSGDRPYQMRIMIDRGKKMVGKRVTVPLETHNSEEAMIKRDAILSCLDSLGVKLVGNFPRKTKNKKQ